MSGPLRAGLVSDASEKNAASQNELREISIKRKPKPKWPLAISHLDATAFDKLKQEKGGAVDFRRLMREASKDARNNSKIAPELIHFCKGLAACRLWAKSPNRIDLNRGAASLVNLHRDRDGLSAISTASKNNILQRDSAAMPSTHEVITLLLLAFAQKKKKPPLEFSTWHPYAGLLRYLLNVGLATEEPKVYRNEVARTVYARLYKLRKKHNGVFPLSEASNCWSEVVRKCG